MYKALPCILAAAIIGGCASSIDNNLTGVALPERPAHKTTLIEPAQTDPVSCTEITEPAGALSLEQALSLTLANNPALNAFSYEVRAAEARALQAGLRPNPELEIEVENFAGSGASSGFDSAETTIAVSQLIETGKKNEKRKKAAKLESRISEEDYQAERIRIKAAVEKAFVDLLAAQERAELSAEMMNAARRAAEAVEQRVAAGKDSPLEQTKAKVALSTTRIEHREAITALETARKTMASLWAGRQPSFTEAEGSLSAISNIPDIDILEQQLINSPRLKRASAVIAGNKAALELERAKSKQDMSITGGFRHFNDTDESAFVFGLSIPLPLNNRNQGGRMEAAAKLSQSRQLQQAASIEARNQLHSIHAELTGAVSRANELETAVLPGAQQLFDATQEAYRLGKIDYLNVLDAQRTCFSSQNAYLDALVDCHKALISLEELTGQNIYREYKQTEHNDE